MNKLKKIIFALAVAVSLGLVGASSALAAETYAITETPTFVINVGRSEALGAVRITPQTGTITIASSIDILYRNVGCDNTPTNGVALALSGVYNAGNTTLVGVVNTSAGCTITISIAAGVTATDTDVDGDFDENSIEVTGVRGRIDVSPAFVIGTDIEASVNATPSGSSLFISPTTVRVATSQPGKIVTFLALTQARCLAIPAPAPPRVRVTEGFPGAFVQHVVSAAGTPIPVAARPLAGGLNNTQIRLEVASSVGITLTWPATVVGTPAGAGSLELLPTSTATVVIYEFTSADQGISDITTGQFDILPVVTLAVGITTPATSTVAVQLWPGLTVGDAVITSNPASAAPFATAVAKPRFNDPLTAATLILTVNPCATYLLYPWVVYTSAAAGGWNTGITVSNVTKDPSIIGTVAQTGDVNLYFFPKDAAPLPAYNIATNLASGFTTAQLVSNILGTGNFFEGYVIAVCNFQLGHGFAYLFNNYAPPSLSPQGYVAISITNPRLPAAGTDPVPTITESRGQ